MTDADRTEAFINGWYAKGSTGSGSDGMMGGPRGGFPGGDNAGGPPSGGAPDGAFPDGNGAGGPPDMNNGTIETQFCQFHGAKPAREKR